MGLQKRVGELSVECERFTNMLTTVARELDDAVRYSVFQYEDLNEKFDNLEGKVAEQREIIGEAQLQAKD
jgi:hypothetical protein